MKELIISSKENEKIKWLRKLGQKKYRDESGKFLVENFSIIEDAATSGIYFESLFLTKNFFEKNKDEVSKILKKSDSDSFFLIDENINKFFSELETPSGICAVYRKTEKEVDFAKPIVYLNGISDPGNLGNILRSALAFDFLDVVLDENCVDLYNPKVVNAAKDSIFKLNNSFDNNLKLLKQIKKKMKIFSTDVRDGKDINSFGRQKLFCLVLGNESRGVSEKIKKISDDFINIKTGGKIESLNVASSAAIIFHSFYKG